MEFLNRKEFGEHVGGSNFDTLGEVAFSYDVDNVRAPYRRAPIAEAMGHPAIPQLAVIDPRLSPADQ